jgi:MFS family permease
LAWAHGPWSLSLGVLGFQMAVNLLFSPMGPLIADYIPDERKGRIAGLLNCGLPVATGAVSIVAWIAPFDGAAGFGITAGLVLACVLPLLLLWPFHPLAQSAGSAPRPSRLPWRNITLAWGARCLLQLGATLLTSYLYPYIGSLLKAGRLVLAMHTDAAVGWMSLWAGLAACSGAVLNGFLSDRLADRRKLMVTAALLGALALACLAAEPGWALLVAAYALFHFSLAAFFAVEAAFVAEMVAGSARRGRLLGVMNLANTLPAILTAALTMRASGHLALDAAMPLILITCSAACGVAALLCGAMVDGVDRRKS